MNYHEIYHDFQSGKTTPEEFLTQTSECLFAVNKLYSKILANGLKTPRGRVGVFTYKHFLVPDTNQTKGPPNSSWVLSPFYEYAGIESAELAKVFFNRCANKICEDLLGDEGDVSIYFNGYMVAKHRLFHILLEEPFKKISVKTSSVRPVLKITTR